MRKITTPHGEYLCKYVEEDGYWSFYTLPQYEEEFEGDFVSESYLPKEDPTDEELVEAFEWTYFTDNYEYRPHKTLISVYITLRTKDRAFSNEHYICENMELAVKLARKMQYDFCVEHGIERKPHKDKDFFAEITTCDFGTVARGEDGFSFFVRITELLVATYKE